MTKLIKLDKEDIKITSKIEEYRKPDFIYIPLPPKKEDLKKETDIKKESLLYKNMYAPISGKLKNVESCFIANGKKTNCLVIENDFFEKREKNTAVRKKISELTKGELLESIFDSNLKEKLEKTEYQTILISGIDDEPYIENQSFLQRNYTKEILETITALQDSLGIEFAQIILKNTDTQSIVAYQSILGMYKNIELKLVEDLYLLGKEEFLINYLNKKEKALYLKASEVYEIYVNIKKRKPLVNKFITISGNGVKNPLIINTKIGVKVVDLFVSFFQDDFKDCIFYVNGVMQGLPLDLTKVIVTKELDGIIVLKQNRKTIEKCSKCGKCIRICPIHSNPLLAYKLGIKVKCIHCGLCTYICPSYIPLQNYLRGDENE